MKRKKCPWCERENCGWNAISKDKKNLYQHFYHLERNLYLFTCHQKKARPIYNQMYELFMQLEKMHKVNFDEYTHAIRTLKTDCDEEAMRLGRLSSDWVPGDRILYT